MSKFRFELEGFTELRERLARIDKPVGNQMAKANRSVGDIILRQSERRRAQMAGRFPSYRSGIVETKASPDRSQVEVTVTPGAAEFGAANHPVFGRWMSQSRFRRLVWPLPDREGFMVRPSIEDRFDQISNEYFEAVASVARDVIGD